MKIKLSRVQKNIDITHKKGSLEYFIESLKKKYTNKSKDNFISDANKLKIQRKKTIIAWPQML